MHEVIRENMRETGWSISGAGVEYLRGVVPSKVIATSRSNP